MLIRVNNILIFVLILCFCAETYENICGGLLTNDYGLIASPNYPNSYSKHLFCKWNVSVAQNHSILLVFEDFYTFENDFLNVFDVSDKGLTQLGRFSGRNHPKHLISSHNKLYLNFSTESNPRKGFKIAYQILDHGLFSIVLKLNFI